MIYIFRYDFQISHILPPFDVAHVHTFAQCFITVCVEATPAPCVESVDVSQDERRERERQRELEGVLAYNRS